MPSSVTITDRMSPSPNWVSNLRAGCVTGISAANAFEFASESLAAELRLFGDAIAILPFFLATTIDLRSARALRLLRVFRILKLARYNAAVHRFHVALLLAKEEIILFMALTTIVLYLAAVGIYHFEHEAQPEQFKSVFHSIWWAITTLTTVGYGDVYPITTGGRMFTFVVLFVGLGIVSVPAGLISAALLRARTMEADEKKSLDRDKPTDDAASDETNS
jgi:voltage-gated potassium channel Kch